MAILSEVAIGPAVQLCSAPHTCLGKCVFRILSRGNDRRQVRVTSRGEDLKQTLRNGSCGESSSTGCFWTLTVASVSKWRSSSNVRSHPLPCNVGARPFHETQFTKLGMYEDFEEAFPDMSMVRNSRLWFAISTTRSANGCCIQDKASTSDESSSL